MQDFVKNLYHVGQTVLQNKDHHADADKSVLNPFQLTVQSNVVCVELLLWAVREEPGQFHFRFRVGITTCKASFSQASW